MSVVGVESVLQSGVLLVGEFLGAAVQDVPDPVERVAGAAPVAVDVLLQSAPDLIDRGGPELHDMKRVQDGDGIFKLIVEGVLVAVERIQGRDFDTGGVLLYLQPIANERDAVVLSQGGGLQHSHNEFHSCHLGLNFDQNYAGIVTLDTCTWSGTTTGRGYALVAEGVNGSPVFDFKDPIGVYGAGGKFPVRCVVTYQDKATNTQKRSDGHRTVKGTNRDDVIVFVLAVSGTTCTTALCSP
jgi:hypothetical protein